MEERLNITKPDFFTYENLKPIIVSVGVIILAILQPMMTLYDAVGAM